MQGQFASRRGFPGVSLAVDGSHIPFRPKNRSFFMDYHKYFKGWTSILAVAFVDSYYRFIFDVDVGYPGRAGDNTVLSRSPLMASIASEPDKWLGKGGVILGDSGRIRVLVTTTKSSATLITAQPNPKSAGSTSAIPLRDSLWNRLLVYGRAAFDS